MKDPDFLHFDTNSLNLKEKYWGGHGHKRVSPLWSQDSISCIS